MNSDCVVQEHAWLLDFFALLLYVIHFQKICIKVHIPSWQVRQNLDLQIQRLDRHAFSVGLQEVQPFFLLRQWEGFFTEVQLQISLATSPCIYCVNWYRPCANTEHVEVLLAIIVSFEIIVSLSLTIYAYIFKSIGVLFICLCVMWLSGILKSQTRALDPLDWSYRWL